MTEAFSHKDLFSVGNWKKDVDQKQSNADHRAVTPKSFAEALTGKKTVVLPPVQCPPEKKGAYVSVKINSSTISQRMEACRFSLIGRVILAKGDKPWTLASLKARLDDLWKLKSWRLISLGKGYFQIILVSDEDKARVWGSGSLNLKPGIMRLHPWSPFFKPSDQKTTNAQVWVRIYELPWVFWEPQVLSDIARAIGVPIKIDRATVSGDFGHYARILVDVDLKQPLLESLQVEYNGVCLFVKFEYERVPPFCSICSTIGHFAADCYHNKKKHDGDNKQKDNDMKENVIEPSVPVDQGGKLPEEDKIHEDIDKENHDNQKADTHSVNVQEGDRTDGDVVGLVGKTCEEGVLINTKKQVSWEDIVSDSEPSNNDNASRQGDHIPSSNSVDEVIPNTFENVVPDDNAEGHTIDHGESSVPHGQKEDWQIAKRRGRPPKGVNKAPVRANTKTA